MSAEMERLLDGPGLSEAPGGVGTVRFLVYCIGNGREVLATARETLQIALELSSSNTFDERIWASRLPEDFVRNSGPSPSKEELDRQLRRPIEERLEDQRSQRWSVKAFMNSFLPELDLRCWSWWDAVVLDENHIAVAVEVSEWPVPWQSLRWLFRGSGAVNVEPEPE